MMVAVKEIAKSEARSNRDGKLRIFDCDVHPVPRQGLSNLTPYLPRAWRQRFDRKQAMHDGLNVPIRFKHPNGSVVRQDACAPDGGPSGSDPQYLVKDLLDAHCIEGALLNCFDAGGLISAQSSTEESIVLAAAYNDYFIEEWLSVDPRLKYAPAVPTQDPASSAAEVRRIGQHPQVAAVFIPLVNVLMGHRYYWPIYEACEQLRLPIYLHVTGIESIFSGTPTLAMGTADSYIEPGGDGERGKPHLERHPGEVSQPQVHLRRVRIPVGAIALLSPRPHVSRSAPRCSVGAQAAERISARAFSVHDPAVR